VSALRTASVSIRGPRSWGKRGGLGRQQLFTDSLPDLDRATAVVYVDLQKAADISGDELPSQVAALRSVGLTASSTGDESDIHLRLVAG